MVQALWRTVWQFLKNVHLDLPYDPAISRLGTYTKELKAGNQTHSCPPMFVAAFFTDSQKVEANQVPIHPSMDKQNVFTYNGILFRLLKEGKSSGNGDVCTTL